MLAAALAFVAGAAVHCNPISANLSECPPALELDVSFQQSPDHISLQAAVISNQAADHAVSRLKSVAPTEWFPCRGQSSQFEWKQCFNLPVLGDRMLENAVDMIGAAYNLDVSELAADGIPIIRYLPGAPAVGVHGDVGDHGEVPETTLVLYLTDGGPHVGGRTFFPGPQYYVTPKRGSCLSIENGHNSTRHGVEAFSSAALHERLVIQIPTRRKAHATMLSAYSQHVSGTGKDENQGFEHYGYAFDYGDGYGDSSSEPGQVDQDHSGSNYRLAGNSKLRGRLEQKTLDADTNNFEWIAVCPHAFTQNGAATACNSIEPGSTLVKTYTAAAGGFNEDCPNTQVAILCAPAAPAQTCRNSAVCPSTAQKNALAYENPDHMAEECCIVPSNASFAVAFHTRVHTTHNFEITTIALEVPAAFKDAFNGAFNGAFREGTEPTIQYFAADINTNPNASSNAPGNEVVRTLAIKSATFREDAGNCTNDKLCGYRKIARAIHGPKINGPDTDNLDCAGLKGLTDEAVSTVIDTQFDLFGSKSMTSLFQKCEFENPQAIESLDVSNVAHFKSMFMSAHNFNGILESWNVGSATDMANMFYDTNAFDGTVGGWDVRNVNYFRWMFQQACAFTGRKNSGGKTIQDWNVSSGTDFRYMFDRRECANAGTTDGIQYNLSSWHTSLKPSANIKYIFGGYANTSTLKSDTCWYPGDGECESGGYRCFPNLTKCDGYQPPPGGGAVATDEDARRRERRSDPDPDPDAVVLFDIFVKPPGVGNAPIMIPGTMAHFNQNDHCSRHAAQAETFCSDANASFYFDTDERPCKGETETCDATDCCKGGTKSNIYNLKESVNATDANADVDVVFKISNAPAEFENDTALQGHAITLHDFESAATVTGTIKGVKNISIGDPLRRTRRDGDGARFIATATVAFTAKIKTPFKPDTTAVMVGPKQEPKTQKKSKSSPKLKLKKSTTSGTPVAAAVVAVAAIVVVVVIVGASSLKSEQTRKGNSGDYAPVYTTNPVYDLDTTF